MSGLMGICASCLGLNRRKKSDDIDETDALLDDRHTQYGAVPSISEAEPDEEELRREREALEQITNNAADHMIDVSHSRSLENDTGNLDGHATAAHPESTHPNTQAGKSLGHGDYPAAEGDVDEEDEEEAAWLESLEAENTGNVTEIKGLGSGDLVIDIRQLRRDAT